MAFIIGSCRSAVGIGPVFPLICLVEPVLAHFEHRSLRPMRESMHDDELLKAHNALAHVVHTEHEAFLRTKRLSKMAKQELREEVISAGIGEYIIRGKCCN